MRLDIILNPENIVNIDFYNVFTTLNVIGDDDTMTLFIEITRLH